MLTQCVHNTVTIQAADFQMPKSLATLRLFTKGKNKSYALTEKSHPPADYQIGDSLGKDSVESVNTSGRHEV